MTRRQVTGLPAHPNPAPFVGQRVLTSGYLGTVVKVCEWSRQGGEVMVEVRLSRGVACVDAREAWPVRGDVGERFDQAARRADAALRRAGA